ncbi:glycosyltransferase family 4 protein [Treponema socranskii]|uniref:glycosyltransferase family 4 protein n=1 Tax=Treponema socranskii TaxID=53419 RepID=UPI003D89BFDD
MKIAVDARMLGSGGIGTYIASLLPYFLEKNECFIFGDTEAIAPFAKYENAETAECRVKTFSLAERFAFPCELRKKINSCDVYYTPYCNIPSGIKIPVFSTIHDVVFLDVPGLASKAGVAARKYFYQRAIDRSRAVFTVSEFSKDRIRATLDCKKCSIVVTYSALPEWLSLKPSEIVYKIRQLLFVGNIKKHKGLSVLLDALKKAREKGFDMPLVIAGNAENFRTRDAEIARNISSLPEGTVRFTGRISDTELSELYRTSTLLVQPSLYEGFGLPPLEALSLGTKALISDIPVFKEIYDGFSVTFFRSGDSDDLAEKLAFCANDASPIPSLPDRYSFKKSADIILAALDFYRA